MKFMSRPLLAALALLLMTGAAEAQLRNNTVFRPLTSYAMDATGSSTTRSATFQTFVIRLASAVSFHFTVGPTPLTVTISDTWIPPNTPTLFGVNRGDYIAVIRTHIPAASDPARAIIWITEMD